MHNPGLPPDTERHHPDLPPEEKPPSETVIKTAKKAGINWIVAATFTIIAAALMALGRAQVSGMLVNYEPKEQAEQRAKEYQARMDALQSEANAHYKEVEAQNESLQHSIADMDKKIDHLTFTLEWMQSHQARNGTPKDQP